jgi:hypothetical protein
MRIFLFTINSHSPQFIEAIEVLSEKYELENDINFMKITVV